MDGEKFRLTWMKNKREAKQVRIVYQNNAILFVLCIIMTRLCLVGLCDINMKLNINNMIFSRGGHCGGVKYRPYYLLPCNINAKVMRLSGKLKF